MHFKWPGFNNNNSVIISLPAESFCLASSPVELQGERFIPKAELHITLVGGKLGTILQAKAKQDKALNALFKKTFEQINWSYQATDIVHLLSRSKGALIEKSIIRLLEVPGVTEFFKQLKAHGVIDTDTPIPPAHVTLYTLNCALGIGVSSDEVLDELSTGTLSAKAVDALGKAGKFDG